MAGLPRIPEPVSVEVRAELSKVSADVPGPAISSAGPAGDSERATSSHPSSSSPSAPFATMSDSKSPSAASAPPEVIEASAQLSAERERNPETEASDPIPGEEPTSVAVAPPRIPPPPAREAIPAPPQAPLSSGEEEAGFEQPTLHPDDDPLINVVLHDTYRIARVIGEGGMGRVYEAWHTRISNKRYAIKVLHEEYARNIGILKRFQREAETAACISHPNAVGVYDVDIVPIGHERPYLVSEYLEGVDLSHWIKQQAPLDVGFVKHITLQMCDALIEAHRRGVVHRDLKPQNIFLLTDKEGSVPPRPVAKVLDFGLSRFVDDADSELTRSGMVMGTPSYMSPEQARGERADHRVDVYGLGAVMFASVTGRPPYKSSSPQATVLAVMNEEAPRPSKLNPNVSPELELIIQKAMARDPNRRYGTMQELRDELDALLVDKLPPRRPKVDSLLLKKGEAPSLRAQLSFYWLLAFCAGLGATVAAVWAAVLLFVGHWPLSRNATLWLSLVLVVGLIAPVAGVVKRVRRSVWTNTAHVADALQATRQVTLGGLATYGALALSLLATNLFWQLFDRQTAWSTGALSSLAGVTLVCWVAAGCAAAAIASRLYLRAPGGWVDAAGSDGHQGLRRFAAGPLLVGTASAMSALAVAGAAHFQPVERSVMTTAVGSEASKGSEVSSADTGAPASVPVPVLDRGDAGPAVTAPSPSVPLSDAGVEADVRLRMASASALSAALSQGSAGLQALREQHPNDPAVLRAVAFDHASTSSGLPHAVATFRALFEASPQATADEDVQQIILSIARGQSNAKRSAFELMAKDMGHIGPDMLYRLSLSESTRPQALAYLARPSVRERFSPALAIAYEIRFASSCARRLPLLPRAVQFGDDRSVRLLHALSASTKSGCGPRKNKACPAKCPAEAEQLSAALESIKNRLRSTAPAP